jgi:hypothetical protein
MRNATAILGMLAALAAGASTAGIASSEQPKPAVRAAGASGGFNWTDAAIGAGATLGGVIAAAGALTLARTSRRPHDRQSATKR